MHASQRLGNGFVVVTWCSARSSAMVHISQRLGNGFVVVTMDPASTRPRSPTRNALATASLLSLLLGSELIASPCHLATPWQRLRCCHIPSGTEFDLTFRSARRTICADDDHLVPATPGETRGIMANLVRNPHETAHPDTFRLDDALGCGELSEAVREAIVSGDWGRVARLADEVETESRAA